MGPRALKISFVVFLAVALFKEDVEGWFGRRRRRRWNPPPPQPCTVSDWSAWNSCSQICHIGIRSRSRTVTHPEMWGGSCPYHLTESEACGSINGGCDQICDSVSGQCSCQAGYTASGQNCNDIDECSSSPCSHMCQNTVGSFYCECPVGYFLTSDLHTCEKFDCGSPAALFSACPSDSYTDHISSVCTEVAVTCPSGTTYDVQCFLSCPVNYTLAKITAQPNTQFGENYTAIDLLSVVSSIICQKLQASHSANVWDVPDNELNQYFCRRSNDPPLDLKLNGSSLREHSAIGTVIGTLSSEDTQPGQMFIYTVQRPVSLVIAEGDILVSTWDNPRLNGNISLNNGQLSVTIRSTDDGVPPMWLERNFSITVVDVNDPPEHVQLSNSVVYENTTVGSVVGELTAIDGDDAPGTSPHSNFRWELLDSDGSRFAINNDKIIVGLPLVGEAQKLHKITVQCSDYGNPVQNKTKSFIITVVNVNDPPSSLRLLGSTVHETATVGTFVGQLVVTEKDGDDLSFDIAQSDTDTLAKFEIKSSGCQGPGYEYDCKVNVTVKSSLDFEAKAWYILNVLANDSNTQTFKHFNIEIIDDNEAPTAISLTGSHSVLENAIAGTVVGQFVVTDPDNFKIPSHQPHRCEFDVSEPSDESYFVITIGLVLKVKGAQQISYEQIKNLTFTVICTDTGHPPLSLSTELFILVQDVNESPVNLTLSSTTVDENSPLGTPVGVLSSDDLDGPSDKHAYSIVGPIGMPSTPFLIGGNDERTLLVNGSLDHEINPTLLVVIRATDKGGLFTQKTFRITVIDVNDAPTNLTLPSPYFKESSAEQVLISAIILVDQDSSIPYCNLLDSAGGRVKVVGTNLVVGPTMTDYESLPSPQQLNITLNCSDGHSMYIWKSFIISVEDVNERPSAIKVSAMSVAENEADAVIGKVTVLDPDVGQQHRCTVHNQVVDAATSTEHLVPSQFFTVDNSLNLKTLNGLNFEAQHSMDIVINCSDVVAEGRLAKSQLFTITIKDVNEIPSGLCSAPINMGMHVSNGAVIANFNARDPDNENAINSDHLNTTVVVKNKQHLSYQLSPQQNSWPFRIMGSSLYKSGEISQAGNITISVKVKDDGTIVASFSSRGYQYVTSTPKSAIFNCIIVVSEHHQSLGIRLGSNVVSVTADTGAVVGVLTTVSPYPGETFTYELKERAERPFAIIGDKLVVARMDGLDFQVSSSDESVIAITIISTGSVSSVFTESFYITVVDDRPNSTDICLKRHTVYENQPADSVLGQVIIDDSSSPLLTCSKQHCCPANGRHFDYKCNVNNPEDNEIVSLNHMNITALFRLDPQFRLRSIVKLNCSIFAGSNGSLTIQVSCHDMKHPLHFIGKSLLLSFADCDDSGVYPVIHKCPVCQNGGSCHDAIDGYSCQCIEGYTGRHCETNINECQAVECLNGGLCQDGVASFTCNCAGGFSGQRCERRPSLCAGCVGDTLCVMFIDAAIRCLEKQYQIPVLVNETGISPKRKIELEEEIATILELKVTDGNSASARKRRALSNSFYVEILRNDDSISSSQTLLILTGLNASNNFFPLLASEACVLLSHTVRRCVEDCDILQQVGLPCGGLGPNKNIGGPFEEDPKGLETGGVAGIAVVVVIGLIALLFGAIFYYRRKYKVAKQDQGGVSYRTGAEGIDFNNELYVDATSSNTDWAAKLKKESDGFVHHNLNRTSVVKWNDIKVMENPLYTSATNQRESSNLQGGKSVNLPGDITASKKGNKGGDPLDGACGGAMNPCYARSPPLRVSLGTDGDKLPGNEVMQAEHDLDAYIKGASTKARASSVSQLQKFKRQRSDEKESRELERQSLKMAEVPPSFENPIFSGGRGEIGNSPDNRIYSTIRAVPDVPPRLPQRPRPSRRSNEESLESLERLVRGHTYERLNFRNSDA